VESPTLAQANEIYAIGVVALESLKEVNSPPPTAAALLPAKRRYNQLEWTTVVNLEREVKKQRNEEAAIIAMEIDST